MEMFVEGGGDPDTQVRVLMLREDGATVLVETHLSAWLALLASAEVGLEGAVQAGGLEPGDVEEATDVLNRLAGG